MIGAARFGRANHETDGQPRCNNSTRTGVHASRCVSLVLRLVTLGKSIIASCVSFVADEYTKSSEVRMNERSMKTSHTSRRPRSSTSCLINASAST